MKTFHEHMMRVDLEGNLRNLQASRRKFCEWSGDDGQPMRRVDAIDGIKVMLLRGWKYYPMGECDNFDHVSGKCLGHEGPGQISALAAKE